MEWPIFNLLYRNVRWLLSAKKLVSLVGGQAMVGPVTCVWKRYELNRFKTSVLLATQNS